MESESLLPEEVEVVTKWFKKYDLNGDGFLDRDEFRQAFQDFHGGANEEYEKAFKYFHNESQLVPLSKVLTIIREGRVSSKLAPVLERLQSTIKELPDGESEKHHIRISIGNTEHAKTKIDLKVMVDDELGKQHFAEAVKGLTFKKEQVGIIFKFHSTRPYETKEKLEKLVTDGLELLRAMVLKPNTPEVHFVNSLKFEYSQDHESVTLAIHSEHKFAQFVLDYIQVFWGKFNIEKIRGYAHVQLSFLNDFHPLTSDNKDDRDVIKVVKAGGAFTAELSTNADKLLKRLLRPKNSYNVSPPLVAALLFFQKGSRVDIGAEELDFDVFTPKEGSKPVPQLDLFGEGPGSDIIQTIKGGYDAVQQMPLPIIADVVDLLENHLLANVHVSVNTPHIFASFHFKTSGIKELWTKIKNA